jgi:hypothetical protein
VDSTLYYHSITSFNNISYLHVNGSSQVLGMPTYKQEGVSESEGHLLSSTGVLPGLFEACIRAGVAGCRIIVLHLLNYAV